MTPNSLCLLVKLEQITTMKNPIAAWLITAEILSMVFLVPSVTKVNPDLEGIMGNYHLRCSARE